MAEVGRPGVQNEVLDDVDSFCIFSFIWRAWVEHEVSESSKSSEFPSLRLFKFRVVEFRVVCSSGSSSSGSSSMERDVVVTSASDIDIGLRV